MRRVRRAALALATLALVVSVVSTGGFSSVSAERSVSVSVVEDSRAFLTITEPARDLHPGKQRVTLLTLRNRFATALNDVSVTVAGDGAPPPKLIVNDANPVSSPESLAAGGEGHVVVTVVCGGNGRSGEFRVTVDASGPGAGVELNRTVTLVCPVQETGRQGEPGEGDGGNGEDADDDEDDEKDDEDDADDDEGDEGDEGDDEDDEGDEGDDEDDEKDDEDDEKDDEDDEKDDEDDEKDDDH